MDVQALKLQFIEQYLKVNDESINKGLEDVKNGRVFTGDQVRDKLRKKYPNQANHIVL